MSGSLFDRPRPCSEPIVPEQPEKRQDVVVCIKQTKGGQTIMFCTEEPAPAWVIAEAKEKNLPLFVPSEIVKFTAANQEAVDAAIRAKLVMPGSTITSHEEKTA